MLLGREHIEDDAHLGIESTCIQGFEESYQVIGGQIDVASLDHRGNAEADVVIAVRHGRVGGTHIEVVEERATIGHSESGTEAAPQETTLQLRTEAVVGIKVIIAAQQEIRI